MKNTIGKVILNLEFYNGNDAYSDGDIEEEILELIKGGGNPQKIIEEDNRWPVLYHLSPYRHNLLEWYPFQKDCSILEIGAGCGGVTDVLCEKAKSVVAIELSKKRSEINAYRNQSRDNLEIIVGNLNDINIEEKFDYVTLIGVLEYAGEFTGSRHPHRDFLKNIKAFLKPNGKLIVAIENKFGLKYWAGSKEDHTGIQFEGLEGYLRDKGVQTFSKQELQDLLNETGYTNLEFYYPWPDYKFPTQIFSDDYLPQVGELDKETPIFDSDQLMLFREHLVFNNIIANDKFDFFSNSFLVTSENNEGIY